MILLDAYVYGCDCISSSLVYGFVGCFFCMYNGVIIVCTWAVIDYVYELSMNSGFIFWL